MRYKGYQIRKKLMWFKHEFPDTDYQGYAIGMNLDDYRERNAKEYTYWVEQKDGKHLYRIDAETANRVGRKLKLKSGIMPHMVPIELWKEIDFEPKEGIKTPEPEETGPEQGKLL